MLAICIECSHQRGMGHLFRALNLIETLKQQKEPYLLLVNEDEAAQKILQREKVRFLCVDLWDTVSDWEGKLIQKFEITVWLNDRLDTCLATAEHVHRAGILLYTIDDMGAGAALAEGNFASLCFKETEKIPGKTVYAGSRYLILNPQIASFRRLRQDCKNILVTLGGSDTYGVTLQVIAFLKEWQAAHRDVGITVLLGPGSVIEKEVKEALLGTDFSLAASVPSLMSFFEKFDLAITGGGVTSMEAAASGLPCLIIANEIHEIQIGRYLEKAGCAVFAGYYREMRLERLEEITDIRGMSKRGMETVDLSGAERICKIVLGQRKE